MKLTSNEVVVSRNYKKVIRFVVIPPRKALETKTNFFVFVTNVMSTKLFFVAFIVFSIVFLSSILNCILNIQICYCTLRIKHSGVLFRNSL